MKVIRAGVTGWLTRCAGVLLVGLVAAPFFSGCSLTNINADACDEDVTCQDAFGLGSSCEDGYCSEPEECATGHDCRRLFGGGACVDGKCTDFIPPSPEGACREFEPPDLMTRRLSGPDAPQLVGGVFRLDDSADYPMSKGAQLGVREINETSGLLEGQQLGFLICDNGGTNNSLQGDDRRDRMHALLDYLGVTLGVPYVVGPVTSTDSLTAINHLVDRTIPTVLISPSATSPQLTDAIDRLDPSDEFGLFWRTAPSDLFQGQVLANQVVKQRPTADPMRERIAVLYLDDAYGNGLATVFKNTWENDPLFPNNSAQLVPFDPNPDVQLDFPTLAAQVVAANVQGVMMIAIDANRTAGFINEMANTPLISTLPMYLTDGSKDASALLNNPNLSGGALTIIFNQVVGTAPAAPSGSAFDFFSAALQSAFNVDPRDFAFVPNAYDAAYIGSMGVVFASQSGAFDGRSVAAGLAQLVNGATVVNIGKSEWNLAKSSLTTGDKRIDVVGISGNLDFDPALGEAPGPVEVWQPANIDCVSAMAGQACCDGPPPCFDSVAVLTPMAQ